MDIRELIARSQETVTARRVYGEPFVQSGVAIVPAAVVRGGTGGCGGAEDEDRSSRACALLVLGFLAGRR